MAKLIAHGVISLALLTTGTIAAGAEDLVGLWTTKNRATTIEMANCPQSNGSFCATVIADKPDAGEPSIVGKTVGVNFVLDASGSWVGEIVADDGTKLPARLTMPNATRLDLKICLMGMFCDGASYYRVKY